jgi:hypothetical protein
VHIVKGNKKIISTWCLVVAASMIQPMKTVPSTPTSTIERLPIVAARLHHHRRHPLAEQVVDQRKDLRRGRTEGLHRGRVRPRALPGTLTATFASRLEMSMPAARS